MATGSRELEVKLGAWAGFQLPDLAGAVEGATVVPVPDCQLDATYYDTADLRLARSGISVRFRSGEGAGEGAWTVKLPDGEAGPALVRREITFDGPPRVIPTEVSRFVRAHVRDAFLGPVAHLSTRRRRLELRDPEGVRVGEVDDDEVSVHEGRRLAVRFREVEVEVDERAPQGLLDAVVVRLREAGAGLPDPTPKLVRALGPRALEPPDVVPVALDKRSTVTEAVQAALAGGAVRLLRHDPGMRLGDDPEDVHQARRALRRLRSDLRLFREVLDPGVTELREELGWLAGELGVVCDADVLLDRLRSQAATLPNADARAAGALLRRLAASREEGRARLLEALDGDRYLALVEALVTHAASPPVVRRAGRRAAKELEELLSATADKLRARVKKLGDDVPVQDLLGLRTRAERARHAGEAAAPVVGKRAARFAKAAAGLDDVLTGLHEAVDAETWLREASPALPPEEAVVAGELISLERDAVERDRSEWRAAWKSVLDRWPSGG